MVDRSGITYYLLARGCVRAQSIIEADLRLLRVAPRNWILKVVSEQGLTYLAKQGTRQGKIVAIAVVANFHDALRLLFLPSLACVPRRSLQLTA